MGTFNSSDRHGQIRNFLASIFEPADIVELRELPAGASIFARADELAAAADQLAVANERGRQNIYVGANPRRQRGGKTDADVEIARTVFVDFDGLDPGEAVARLDDAKLPRPTAIVASGHGTHCYWRLDEPTRDLAAWAELQRDVAAHLGGDPVIFNPSRIMRLPGFLNLKSEPVACELLSADPGRRFTFAELRALIPARQQASQQAGNLVGLVGDPPSSDNRAERCKAYLERTPDSVQGEHGSDKMLRAACECRRFDLADAETRDVLAWFNAAKCQPAWSEKEIAHKVASAAKLVSGADVGSRLRERPAVTAVEGTTTAAVAEACNLIEVLNMGDVQAEDVRWLWKGRIASGCITILAGPAGGGKGVVTMDLAARVTTGRRWPDGSGAPDAGRVILFSGEDDPKRVIKPRLDAAAADASRVDVVKAVVRRGLDGKNYRDGFTLADVPHLESLLKSRPDCRLVIVDPIGDFIGGRTQTDKDNQVRAVMQPIAALAETYDVAIVIVAHYRKSEATEPDDKVMGSRGFTGLARNVWHLVIDEANERRLLLAGKSNLAAPADGIAFTTEGVAVANLKDTVPMAKWQPDPIPMTAGQWLAEQRGEGRPGPKPKQVSEAEEFIRTLLADRIIISSAEAEQLADTAGISTITLRRAKKKLQVLSYRQGEGKSAPWYWCADQSLIIEQLIASANHRRALAASIN